MPYSRDDAKKLIARRHPEWVERQKVCRWLQDTLEGGDRYRHADYSRSPFECTEARPWYAFGYGRDATTNEPFPFSFGQICERNLVPHPHEMSRDNVDLYALRLHRTPVPAHLARVARRYLSRIYSHPVARKGPPQLDAWWLDVDGQGTPIGKWFRKTVGPLLLAVGQLDLVAAHPAPPEGAAVKTRADLTRLGLKEVVAGYILAENMAWWELDDRGRYRECLVHERGDRGEVVWRHWHQAGCDAYTDEGEYLAARSYAYPFKRPPIVRVFDDRILRLRNAGKSRLETVAELQRNIYNRDSELILGDVTGQHSILQGPEDFATGDDKVPLMPGGVLPKKAFRDGTGYEGWDVVAFSQAGAAECRTHAMDDRDEVLAEAALVKPAGSTGAGPVAQSGVSKGFDAREGNDVLSEVAATLRDAELAVASLVLLVASDGKRDADPAHKIDYPREYDLFTASDLAEVLADLQALAGAAGALPETEGEILRRLISVLLPGLDEERMAELHAEVGEMVDGAAARLDQGREAGNAYSPGGGAAAGGGYDAGPDPYATDAGPDAGYATRTN